jgi:predicted nucleic acid-binding protein
MPESWLIFIDTNIFLDFYRQSGESAERQLKALEKHKSRLITGDQVRMEFLKNRQKVIAKSLKDLKAPTQDGVPQIFSGTMPANQLIKHQKEAKNQFSKIKKKAELMLSNPQHHDKVYTTFNRIFDSKSSYNLCRPKRERFEIRNLARKRFVLGYPPRKDGDTSIGDSINWEWIIYCAKNSDPNTHILIVSRDSDYGLQYEGQNFINDWLEREFKDRVSRKRKIELTAKLTVALKRLEERVTPEDEKEEENLIRTFSSGPLGDLFLNQSILLGQQQPSASTKIDGLLAALLGLEVGSGTMDEGGNDQT